MLPQTLEGIPFQETIASKDFQDYLFDLNRENSTSRHANYKETVEHAKEMGVHAWGEKPYKILEDARPREDPAVRKYRLDSWEPITESDFDKAISILQKIFNPKLYSITFPAQPSGVKLTEEETLERYLLEFYPEYDSIFMFCREVLLRQMIADPNGIVAVVPGSFNVEQTEFVSPHVVLFNSSQVLDYVKGSYYVLKDQLTVKDGKREGSIIHLFTNESIITLHEKTKPQEKGFYVFAEYKHNFQLIPVWFLGGGTHSKTHPYYYTSFFKSVLPHWNKAIRHESDLDGAYVNHLHPQKWEHTIDCDYSDSHGRLCHEGVIRHDDDTEVECRSCKGTGRKTVRSPFDVYSVNKDSLNPDSIGGAPAGYIQGIPVEIVTKLEDRVASLINKGLSSINMDIVNMIGADQSGIAKEYDRTELHSFMQQISDYIFDNHVSNILYFINRYRYETILGPKYNEYLPIISKPTTFDTLSIRELTDEVAKARLANVNPDYIKAIEKDAAGKRFSTNAKEKDKILAILDLNPFSNQTVDDKINMLLDSTVSKLDVVISNNISQFVERAIDEENNFLEMERGQQKEVLKKYADEILSEAPDDIIQPTLRNAARPISQ